ncbi:hypothetical protein HID58_059575 [Brassica napus]|uniref:Uncharacterized protein n=1 Tax=Brassica napus TaxID=3708 RepID=A0ABQ7ZTC1_BRANA|nr:hypothetical protein HID58_059575 [Brassica napus]
MICSSLPIQRLQLISNRSRRESKPPPPSPLMTRNRRYKVDQREELNYDANSEVSPVKASLGSEATVADVSIQHDPWDSIHYFCHLICSYFCNWPFKINDCHKLKVSDVSLDKFDDQYFGKVAENSPLYFFTCFLFLYCAAFLSCPYVYTPRKCLHKGKNDQKAVDGALIKAIEVVSELNICLGTRKIVWIRNALRHSVRVWSLSAEHYTTPQADLAIDLCLFLLHFKSYTNLSNTLRSKTEAVVLTVVFLSSLRRRLGLSALTSARKMMNRVTSGAGSSASSMFSQP